jgi:integrase
MALLNAINRRCPCGGVEDQRRRRAAVQPGCTFHGLRHTIASRARESEESEFRVAAAIGDRTTAMAAIYGRDADRGRARGAILAGVQKRFENTDWKMTARPLEKASPAAATELPAQTFDTQR